MNEPDRTRRIGGMTTDPSALHRYTMRVYYDDTDAGGVVYHANYLRFAEHARTEALRDAGIPHAEMVERCHLMFVVHRAEIDYVHPVRLDDTLVIETETVDVGGATVVLRQTVKSQHGVCAVARIRLACVQIGGNRPARIPPRWRQAMLAMRRAEPRAEQGNGAEPRAGSGSHADPQIRAGAAEQANASDAVGIERKRS